MATRHKTSRHDKLFFRDSRLWGFTETRFARSCQIAKQIKSLAKQYHQNQSIFKIKSQKRRPRKGRLGGDRAAFATPSRVPSIEKFGKAKKTVSYGKCSLVICLQVASNLLASRSPHCVRHDNPELARGSCHCDGT